MIYIVDEKDVGVLSDGTVNLSEGDSVRIFVKDMEKPIFSARNYNVLSFLGKSIEFVQAATKEELIFMVGGLAGSGSDCTLLQMDISIPEMFAEHVKVLVKKEKSSKPKKPRQPKKPKAEVPVEQKTESVPADAVSPSVEKEPETKAEPTAEESH